jgi:VanZ family protein
MEEDEGCVCGLKFRKFKPSRLQLVAQNRINNMLCAVLYPLTTQNYPDPSYSLSDPFCAHTHTFIDIPLGSLTYQDLPHIVRIICYVLQMQPVDLIRNWEHLYT